MKQIFVLLACIMMLAITSCQFSENIYINEDGSGKMEFSMDASEMMKMVSEMGDGTEETGFDEAMDSTIVFKDLLYEKRDSISKLSEDEQAKLKALERFTMHVVADPESSKMVFDIITDFEDANELQDMFKALNSFSNMQGKGGAPQSGSGSSPFSSLGSDGSTDISYSFDGSVFKRSARVVDKEKHQQAIDSLGQATMIFSSSRYKINYHFPRPVKSISKEGAMYSEDRKTVSLEVGFMEAIADPKVLDFEVILEDK